MKFSKIKGALIVLAIVGVLFGGVYGCHSMTLGTVQTIEINITDAFTKRGSGDDADKYMVETEDETFENTDTLMFWKFNSSDLQRELKQHNGPVRVKVAGWRSTMLSSYRNIIEIVE